LKEFVLPLERDVSAWSDGWQKWYTLKQSIKTFFQRYFFKNRFANFGQNTYFNILFKKAANHDIKLFYCS